MGINSERDIEANMQIGPTDHGMVRLFIEADGVEIPMDFDPEEAEEIGGMQQAWALLIGRSRRNRRRTARRRAGCPYGYRLNLQSPKASPPAGGICKKWTTQTKARIAKGLQTPRSIPGKFLSQLLTPSGRQLIFKRHTDHLGIIAIRNDQPRALGQ